MATIQKQGRGYKITVSQGYDYAGKRLRQYMTWVPEPGMSARQIKKELERQAVLFEEKVLTGATSNGNMRFADFAEKYMTEYAQLYLKPKTIATYTEHLQRINQALGHIRLCDLRTGHINSFYQNLQEKGIRNRTTAVCKIDLQERIGTQRGAMTAFAGRAGVSRATVKQAMDGKPINKESADAIAQAVGMKTTRAFTVTTHGEPLAPASVISYHRTLSSVLSRAVKWGYIQINPADAAEKPSLGGHEAAYLEEDDARQLLELLQPSRSNGGHPLPLTCSPACAGRSFWASAGRMLTWTGTLSPSVRPLTICPVRGSMSELRRLPPRPGLCPSPPPPSCYCWNTEPGRTPSGSNWETPGRIRTGGSLPPTRERPCFPTA